MIPKVVMEDNHSPTFSLSRVPLSPSHILSWTPTLIPLNSSCLPSVPRPLSPLFFFPGIMAPTPIIITDKMVPTACNAFYISPNSLQAVHTTQMSQMYVHGLTPLSSMTTPPPVQGSSKIVRAPSKATTSNNSDKSKDLPRSLLAVFDKRYIKSTRNNGVKDEANGVETLRTHTPSKITLDQRTEILAAAETTDNKYLRKFLRMSSNDFKNLKRRSAKMGRPSYILEDGFHRIHDAVEEAEASKRSLTREEVNQLLRNEAEISAREANRPAPDPVKLDGQLWRLMKQIYHSRRVKLPQKQDG